MAAQEPALFADRFEVVDVVGAGGMGVVYRVTDQRTGRTLALKTMRHVDGDSLARFKDEFRAVADLRHPNLVHLIELFETPHEWFFTMEYVDGRDLVTAIGSRPDRPWDWARLRASMRQLCGAVRALHAAHRVHRDLKPSNVLVTDEGRVVLLDFGLSVATVHGAQRGDVIAAGTAAYMAPEQARGKKVDKRADVWAFGAILYEMLTGRQAFSGETISDTIVSVLSREIDWAALPSSVPPRIHRLLRRCLHRDANDRLRDIGDARLEIADADFLRRPEEPGERSRDPPRQHEGEDERDQQGGEPHEDLGVLDLLEGPELFVPAAERDGGADEGVRR